MREKRTSPKAGAKKLKCPAPKKVILGKSFITYHPRSVLQGGFEFEDKIIQDFSRFRKAALKAPRRDLPTEQGIRSVGFDTEYTPDNTLLTIGVATPEAASAYEVSDKAGIKAAQKVIRNAKTLVGHSITGDLDQLVKLGLAKERWLRGCEIRDSFLLARMVDENRGKGGYGLEALLLSEFNSSGWKSETEALLKRTGNAADWSVSQRTDRCRLDAWATAVLAEHFEGKLNAEDRD